MRRVLRLMRQNNLQGNQNNLHGNSLRRLAAMLQNVSITLLRRGRRPVFTVLGPG